MGAMATRQRVTIKSSASIEGIGLQSGKRCQIAFSPFDEQVVPDQKGITFRRLDLPNRPTISASLDVLDNRGFRTTNLTCREGQVGTIEHVMAALSILSVDDILIDVRGPEIPILDGSAKSFVELIKSCERIPSGGSRFIWSPTHPVAYQRGQTQLIALPNKTFKVSCLINYPQSPLIGCQFFTNDLDEAMCTEQLAPARTFCLLHEAREMRREKLMLGGSSKNALIVDCDRILSEEGLRFENEMVRHKTLDLIGDLGLLDFDLNAHIIAICPSHEANASFAKELQHRFEAQ